MARQRIIYPDFFTEDDILEMDESCRLFYIATWTVAEDSGVIPLSPRTLSFRSGIDQPKVKKHLDYLIKINKIIVFQDGYGWLKNFFKYQKVPKPSPPKLPLPKWIKFKAGDKPHLNAYIISRNIPGIVQEHSTTIPTEDKRSKEKIREDKKNLLSGNESPDGPVLEVLGYLNEKADRSFTAKGKQADFIRQRLKDGATVDQLKKIIDNMATEWLGTDQAKFLRPQTLFAPLHFEDYLDRPSGSNLTDHNAEAKRRFLEATDAK